MEHKDRALANRKELLATALETEWEAFESSCVSWEERAKEWEKQQRKDLEKYEEELTKCLKELAEEGKCSIHYPTTCLIATVFGFCGGVVASIGTLYLRNRGSKNTRADTPEPDDPDTQTLQEPSATPDAAATSGYSLRMREDRRSDIEGAANTSWGTSSLASLADYGSASLSSSSGSSL